MMIAHPYTGKSITLNSCLGQKILRYYYQMGGGGCSLCGSPCTTKTTCPDNPKAKNPNPDKHPNAKTSSSKKSSVKKKNSAKKAPAKKKTSAKKAGMRGGAITPTKKVAPPPPSYTDIAPMVPTPPPPHRRPPLRRANAMTRPYARNVALQHARSGTNWKKAATKMRARSEFLKPIYHNIQVTVPLDILELYDNMQLNPHNQLEPFTGDSVSGNTLLMYLLHKHKNDCVIMSTTGDSQMANEITVYYNKIIMLPTGLPTGMDLTSTIQSFQQRKRDYQNSMSRKERVLGYFDLMRPEIKRVYNRIALLDKLIKELTSTNMEGNDEFIKMIRDCTKPMIIIPIHLKFDDNAHENMIIINKRLKTIEWYEPHGFKYGGDRNSSEYSETIIINEFKKLFKPLKGYKIYSPSQLMTGCPRKSGLQQYNKYLDTLQTRDTVHGRISGPEGYCVLFSMILADIRLTYPLVPPLDLMKNTIKLLTSTPEILRDFVYGYSLKLQELMKVVGDHAVEYIHLSALENPTISQRWRKEKLHKEIWEWQVKQLQEHSTCDTCHIVLDDEAHRGATLGARYRAHKEAVTPGRRLLAAQTVVSGARARERDAQMRAALAAERAALLAVSPEEKAAWHAVAIRRTQASIDQESDRPVLLTEDKAVREALSVEDEAASAPPGGKAPRRLRRL